MKKGQVQQVRRWEGKGVDISLIVELNARRVALGDGWLFAQFGRTDCQIFQDGKQGI